MNREERKSGKNNLSKFGKGVTAFTASSFFAASTISTATAETVCSVGNLEQLQTAGLNADCDIINVNANISFDALEEETQTILINHSTLIRGNVTIDGNRTGSVFGLIEDDIDVTFKGLTIVDGGWDVAQWLPDGGFDFNYSGGAITTILWDGFYDISYNSDITLDGVTFENNSANFGGAVALAEGSDLIFTGNTSYFRNNLGYFGGAVSGLYFSNLDMNNKVVFDGNQAIIGGAVGGWVFNSISTSDGTQFKNNDALIGGAISGLIINQIDIRNTYFGNNSAFDEVADLSKLEAYSELIDIDDDDFPITLGTGGAINSGLAGSLRIENSTFFNNSADLLGGAIIALGESQIVLSTFLNNSTSLTATEDSGASITSNGEMRLFGNIFASDISARGHLAISGDEDSADLGGNFSTSSADSIYLVNSVNPIVNFSELKMSNMPSLDSSYLGSAPILPIENTSVAADAIDLEQFSNSLLELIFSVGRSFPTQDQRGVARSGKYDAGSYEIGARTEEIIPMVKKIVLPSAPARVSAKVEGRKAIRVEWSMPKSAGTGRIVKYEIYRNGFKIATIASNKRDYIDRGLDSNQSYSYRIVSVGTQGNSIKSSQTFSIFPRR